MPTKYLAVPRSFDVDPNDWQRDHIRHHTITVHEVEPHSRATGLVDHRGNPIVAIVQTDPIGFRK